MLEFFPKNRGILEDALARLEAWWLEKEKIFCNKGRVDVIGSRMVSRGGGGGGTSAKGVSDRCANGELTGALT
jgi:hypothetical protein